MEELVRGKNDVFLRKINISSWRTAVAAQYKITSVPNFRVFGPGRQQLGKPTSSVNAVAGLIDQAR